MDKTMQDKAFDTEESARVYAAQASAESIIYIILTADQYFVSTSKKIQPYEKLIDTYAYGGPYRN